MMILLMIIVFALVLAGYAAYKVIDSITGVEDGKDF
jgi:hypothetical protein